jgi:hypothetical protein
VNSSSAPCSEPAQRVDLKRAWAIFHHIQCCQEDNTKQRPDDRRKPNAGNPCFNRSSNGRCSEGIFGSCQPAVRIALGRSWLSTREGAEDPGKYSVGILSCCAGLCRYSLPAEACNRMSYPRGNTCPPAIRMTIPAAASCTFPALASPSLSACSATEADSVKYQSSLRALPLCTSTRRDRCQSTPRHVAPRTTPLSRSLAASGLGTRDSGHEVPACSRNRSRPGFRASTSCSLKLDPGPRFGADPVGAALGQQRLQPSVEYRGSSKLQGRRRTCVACQLDTSTSSARVGLPGGQRS